MIIILFILGMTAAYQADKPCDDACFKRKIEQASKESSSTRHENDWRYEGRRR